MLEDKLLTGYYYRNTPLNIKGSINIITGSGGAKLIVEAFRNRGIPDDIISSMIQVLIPEIGWIRLKDLNIKNIN